ncbi:bifunctional glycosyltransferase family 2/GtrA family protein [Brachybacterium sp. ACRRE]|uniref:bifunctional glycosyltransferase family 2/GtrA family protein n=1 Tax=Brachybacterium sp. ACRRE TaxID=2918184 RepID=UPI001EF2ADDB|nr:bifunctional glycosyltransferase family 2/GtrA family protein [Brachybacterium sp. ACRRE]MCG7311549.1 bifunctional glycosyltransferase family 2/GtrA family protein [Brachybacterium sp. ACRRE]
MVTIRPRLRPDTAPVHPDTAPARPGASLAPTAPAAPTAPTEPAAPARAVVLIPALAPARVLVDLVARLAADDIDVLVVDDGSGPDYEVVFDRCALEGAEVLHLPENRGKGGALRAGIAHVRTTRPGSGVVTADADGQHTLADIRRVRDVLDGIGAPPDGAVPSSSTLRAAPRTDLVLGVRGFDRFEVPLRSRLGNVVSSWVLRLASGARLRDTQTGLRGLPFSRLAWAEGIPGDRYEYEYSMLVRAGREGIGLHQVPIETVYLDDNEASHFRPVRDSLRVLGPVVAFMGSGLLAFALDTLLLLAVSALGAPVWLALAAARVLSASGNFALNRRVVFDGGADVPLGRAVVRYGVLAAVVLGAGVLLVDALVGLGASLLVAKVTTDLALFVLSFLVQRLVVFGRR